MIICEDFKDIEHELFRKFAIFYEDTFGKIINREGTLLYDDELNESFLCKYFRRGCLDVNAVLILTSDSDYGYQFNYVATVIPNNEIEEVKMLFVRYLKLKAFV